MLSILLGCITFQIPTRSHAVVAGALARRVAHAPGRAGCRGSCIYSEEPTWLSPSVRDRFSSVSPGAQKADGVLQNDDNAVLIYYSHGFFGPMDRRDFSGECGFPCVQARYPDDTAEQKADTMMVFPIDENPPENQRGGVAVATTLEAMALYGGHYAQKYNATASMDWRSTVPWTYFNPIQMKKSHSQYILSTETWETRKPAAVFVARNCGGSERNDFIRMLLDHGVQVDSISSCKPGGSSGSWPEGVSTSDKLGALRKYRVYLALENRREVGYVTEKMADGLVSGAATVYLGAPDIDNYVPTTAFIDAGNYESDIERIVAQIKTAISDKNHWEGYRSWLSQSPGEWNQGKIIEAFPYSDSISGQCRLCRFAFATRMGRGWNWKRQEPALGSVPRNGDKFWETWRAPVIEEAAHE